MSIKFPAFRVFFFISSFCVTDQSSLLSCVSPGTSGPQLACSSSSSFVWVDRAYIGRTSDSTGSSFCDSPTIDPARGDCVSSVDDVTNDVNAKCAFYQMCRVVVDYSLINCSATYTGYSYLYAEYECMANQISGANLPSVIISQDQTLTNQLGISYFRSTDFPSSWAQQGGACRIDVQPDTHAIWKILDLRGRLINRPPGCAYSFEVYTRTFYRNWCADLRWTPERFDFMTSHEGESINLLFESKYADNSEGKLFINLNLTDANGNPVNGINITCGIDLVLDQPPLNTTVSKSTSSTSTLLLPSSVTTDTTPSTTYISTTTTSSVNIITTFSSSTLSFPLTIHNPTAFVTPPSSEETVTTTTTTTTTTPGEPLLPWNQSTERASGTNESLTPFIPIPPLQDNGTEVDTTTNGSDQPNKTTVWLIIGVTVGGGLLLIIFVIIIIAICGYKKRLTNSQSPNEVLFAWERAPGATPSPDRGPYRSKDETSPSAKTKPNTYYGEPKSDIYLEIMSPDNHGNSNWSSYNEPRQGVWMDRDTAAAAAAAASGGRSRNYTTIDNQSTLKSIDSQMNPVYGHLALTNYIIPIDGVETIANI